MLPDDLPLAEIVAATAHVDIHMPPSDDLPVALFVFGTNQPASVAIAAERYLRGAAPLVIVTGGVNRHDGTPITRANWPTHRAAPHRVLREHEECRARVHDGTFTDVTPTHATWHPA